MKRILLKTLLFVVCVVLGLILFILPFGSFIGMAFLTNSILVTSLASVFVFGVLGIPGMYWLSGRITKKRRKAAASVLLSIHIILTAVAVYALFFQPLPGIDISMPVEPDGYWDLETGSQIAYRHIAAQGKRKPTPVIRLHGGWAIPEVCLDRGGNVKPHPLDRLAAFGFDVYHYDQVGCGNSSRLDNLRDYTVERHIKDLEAIRKELGSDKIIIVGLSWGSMLAAQYAAVHPNRIAAIVFESPGEIWSGSYLTEQEWEEISGKRPEWKTPEEYTNRLPRLISPRLVLGLIIYGINKELASSLISDKESSELWALVYKLHGNAICFYEPTKFPTHVLYGVGWYAGEMTEASHKTVSDPRPTLSTIRSPILVIRGNYECYPKLIAQEYVDAFPNAEMKELQNCGHLLCKERPEEYYRVVEEFLLRVNGESKVDSSIDMTAAIQ